MITDYMGVCPNDNRLHREEGGLPRPPKVITQYMDSPLKRTPEDNTIHHPQYIFEIDLTSGSLMLALVLDGGSVSRIHCRPTCSDWGESTF